MEIRDRIVELRRIRAAGLLPNPLNWRRHPEAQFEALRAVVAQIGFADALLARETTESLVLIDGHLRRDLHLEATVPVLVLDLSEEEADVLLATLDPIAAMAVPDEEALAELLERAAVPEGALEALQESLWPGPRPGHLRPRGDPASSALPGDPRGRVVGPRGAPPPVRGRHHREGSSPAHGRGAGRPPVDRPALRGRLRRQDRVPRPVASREHPTAKPVELVARCLRNSSAPGEVVLDLFAGSGSTLIAAEQLGRRARAIEIDPAYCEVAIRRWEAFTGGEAVRADG